MANDIVIVNVSQTQAPLPNNLQKKGAFLSFGGTTLTPGAYQILTGSTDLAAILAGAIAVSTASWLSSVVTMTLAAPHGITIGDTVEWTVSGMVPAGYNGTFQVTATTTTAFTYPLASNPGTTTTLGVATDEDVAELNEMNTTFWANGNNVPVYVLELGQLGPVEGVAALTTWLTANPLTFYSYLVPRTIDAGAHTQLLALAKSYAGLSAMQYFFITTSIANMADFSGTKSVVMEVESTSPAIAANEFSLAAFFWSTLSTAPSNTNKVAPFAFRYQVNTTAGIWTGPQLVAFKTAFCNYIASGAEGGISNTIIKYGVTADGRGFNYWYTVDWCQINLKLDLANAIINGSNNPINPLYYNQEGINRLQAVAQNTINRGIAFGMVLAPATVNAVDFITYTTDNPSDYRQGVYNGLSATITPQNGFTQITFNLNVTDFVTT